MVALYIAPIYLAILLFELIRQLRYISKHPNHKTFKIIMVVTILIFFSLTIPLAFLLPNGTLKTILTRFSNYWLGVSLYLFLGLLFTDIIRLIYKLISKDKYNRSLALKLTNIIVVAFTLCMSTYGILNAHTLRTTVYDVNSKKRSAVDFLNVVLVSDLHLGYNTQEKHIESMVNKINACNPDIVVIAGDVFDNEFSAISNPERIIQLLNGIKARYGKFVTYGNHDVEEKILCGFTFSKTSPESVMASDEMNKFIEDSGFTFLYDRGITIYDEKGQIVTYIYGRPDAHKLNFGNTSRVEAKEITSGYKEDYYFICIDHEPSELKELAEAGVDLDLSGHTHNGQLWPGTISIKYLWDNAYGLLKIDDMTSIVTSGVGLFGPNMRTGCIPEIVQIDISLNN